MTGRPTKLTPDTQQRICDALRLGATYELAAQYGGVSYNTLNEWRKRGATELERRDNPRVKEGTTQWETEQPFIDFYEAVQKAESGAVVGWLTEIERAAMDGNWQAAAWKLERRYPQDYGKRQTVKVEDWQSELIDAIRNREIDYDVIADEYGESLAERWFREAGISIPAEAEN